MREIGKILMIAGAILLIPTMMYIQILPTSPQLPIGIAGYVRFANGTVIPEETIVWAENLNTHEKVWRATQDGKFAIPISARTGDKIKVWTEFHGMQASRIITANMSLVTHWVNLTLGYVEQEPLPPYWLLLIPLGMIGVGYAIERRKH
ncbi:MAG: hypothetical protein DRJ69_00350 [Thermoprotei archaeon]|nr:MAG: hypothetical protein DRJ69_00350 [Thermoprotei archaeon]